jgi:hypothetical protein
LLEGKTNLVDVMSQIFGITSWDYQQSREVPGHMDLPFVGNDGGTIPDKELFRV